VPTTQDDPGGFAARFVQRAAEILGEELGGARERGARRDQAPPPPPPREPDPWEQTTADGGDGRHDLIDDLREAVTTVVDRLVEVVEAVVGAASGRGAPPPDAETAPGAPPPPADTAAPAAADVAAEPPAVAATPAAGSSIDAVAVHRAARPVAPGATATVTIPLGPDPAGERQGPIVAGPLLGPGRGRIPARAVTWTPTRLEAAGRKGVVVTVAVPPATRPGEYRLLLRGAGFEAVVGVVVGR
jgi:hypothetical protein